MRTALTVALGRQYNNSSQRQQLLTPNSSKCLEAKYLNVIFRIVRLQQLYTSKHLVFHYVGKYSKDPCVLI